MKLYPIDEYDLKRLLVYAIIGRGLPDIDFAESMQRQGLAKFSGNQWNEAWSWNKQALEERSLMALQELFEFMCKEFGWPDK